MTVTIGRRELLVAFGSVAAAWPLAARGQQSAVPVIGYLNLASPESDARFSSVSRALSGRWPALPE